MVPYKDYLKELKMKRIESNSQSRKKDNSLGGDEDFKNPYTPLS
jgi:hypothetical protein